MTTSQYTSSMFFDNLLEILKFYSDLSKDHLGDLIQCGQILRQSLSSYKNLHIIDCGSYHERLYILSTLTINKKENFSTLNVDSDHLIVDTDYIVNEITDNIDSIAPSTNKTLLTFKMSATYHCCVYVYNNKYPEALMKSYEFMLEQFKKYSPKISFINSTRPEGSKTGPSFNGKSGFGGWYGFIIDADQVYALQYKNWPTVAKQWLTRKSESNWPTSLMKIVIEKLGCHIVPTGYEETHWRLSFSLAELILAHTLTNKQRYIYSLTKFLIKYYCSTNKIEGIKSYQLKTIFFWYCEQKQYEYQSLEISIRNLFDYIITFYQHKYIPHYFIPSFNLIFDKTEDELEIYCNILKDLSKNFLNILLQFIQSTYHYLFVMDKDVIDLYFTDHLRLNLFFKYNFYLFVIYGLFDNEPIELRRARDASSFMYNRSSTKTPTNVEYQYFLSLVTKTLPANIIIINVLNSIADEIKLDSQILSTSEINGIICSIWRCTFQTKSSVSSNYYTCICWSCDMYNHYCRSINNLFDSDTPKTICRSMTAFNYKNLLFTMHYRPTKQTKNIKGLGFMKSDYIDEPWPPFLNSEALYLLDYNIDMAFCAYQVLAYAFGENIIAFLRKQQLRIRSDKHKEIFGEFIEWINQQDN